MSREPIQPNLTSEGLQPEALSNEVLKLKIDDLFQEIETLKRRVALLESQPGHRVVSGPEGADPASGVVSDPDDRL
jgi:hypothetical protein